MQATKHKTLKWRQLFVFLCCSIIMACLPPGKPVPPQPMTRLEDQAYPDFADYSNYEHLAEGIQKSLNYLRKLPPDREISYGQDSYRVSHLIQSLEAFSQATADHPSKDILNNRLRDLFWVYQAAGLNENRSVLFTGYYEPLLQGSLAPKRGYFVPVHSRPSDMVEIDLSLFDPALKNRRIVGQYTGTSVVPYPDRAQLRQRADLNRIAPPIVWLRDEIDLFILQIQGSGRIELDDGTLQYVRYDGSNGRPYRSVGRLLIDQGKISPEAMSMQAIRTYLQQHPQDAEAIMNHNPRYIFFKKENDGPFGALGEPLTAMRSVALDRGIFPSAALVFLTTQIPVVTQDGLIQRWDDYTGFALAQDAGNAIKGPGRIDLFWGQGLAAEIAAGHLKHKGKLYFLVLKEPVK
jgi:membrane-bound lytic murein transglycosylase A